MPTETQPKSESVKQNFVLIANLPVRSVFSLRIQPFELTAANFLQFATEDLTSDSLRARANGLTNAKRAISNRVDALLYWSRLLGFARKEHWGFPRRIETLQEIGFSTPAVLNRLANRQRNILEHEYAVPPSRDNVQDVIDVAGLYLGNTERYLESGIPRAVVYSSESPSDRVTSLRRLAPGCEVLDYDLERGTVSARSSWGAFAPFQVERLDAKTVLLAAQRLLRALVSREAFQLTIESEADFLAIS